MLVFNLCLTEYQGIQSYDTQNKHMDNLAAGNGSFVCPLVGGGG